MRQTAADDTADNNDDDDDNDNDDYVEKDQEEETKRAGIRYQQKMRDVANVMTTRRKSGSLGGSGSGSNATVDAVSVTSTAQPPSPPPPTPSLSMTSLSLQTETSKDEASNGEECDEDVDTKKAIDVIAADEAAVEDKKNVEVEIENVCNCDKEVDTAMEEIEQRQLLEGEEKEETKVAESLSDEDVVQVQGCRGEESERDAQSAEKSPNEDSVVDDDEEEKEEEEEQVDQVGGGEEGEEEMGDKDEEEDEEEDEKDEKKVEKKEEEEREKEEDEGESEDVDLDSGDEEELENDQTLLDRDGNDEDEYIVLRFDDRESELGSDLGSEDEFVPRKYSRIAAVLAPALPSPPYTSHRAQTAKKETILAEKEKAVKKEIMKEAEMEVVVAEGSSDLFQLLTSDSTQGSVAVAVDKPDNLLKKRTTEGSADDDEVVESGDEGSDSDEEIVDGDDDDDEDDEEEEEDDVEDDDDNDDDDNDIASVDDDEEAEGVGVEEGGGEVLKASWTRFPNSAHKIDISIDDIDEDNDMNDNNNDDNNDNDDEAALRSADRTPSEPSEADERSTDLTIAGPVNTLSGRTRCHVTGLCSCIHDCSTNPL